MSSDPGVYKGSETVQPGEGFLVFNFFICHYKFYFCQGWGLLDMVCQMYCLVVGLSTMEGIGRCYTASPHPSWKFNGKWDGGWQSF
jgi:hypothetical protein